MLAGGLLSPALSGVLRRFRDQEQEHADALTTALTSLGGTPPAPPQGVADVDKVVEGLRDVRSRADVLSFLIELETAAVAAYFDAHAKLGEAKLLQSAATIMATEGQHLVVLRRAAGTEPVPNAFETGTELMLTIHDPQEAAKPCHSTSEPGELLLILAIALVVLGPKKLPEAGRSLGRGLREFKDSVSNMTPSKDEDDDTPRLKA